MPRTTTATAAAPVATLPVATLPAAFSLYLDAVRFCAAVLVVLSHYVQHRLVGDAVGAVLPEWGREAVIVFFVLSGFVIAWSTQREGATAGGHGYIAARCARIYSVALPLLLASFAAAAVAAAWHGEPVAAGYQLRRAYAYIPFHLLFMGELWSMSETPPWMPQYWSLGYEAWFYVLFGCASYLRGRQRAVAMAAVLLAMGPKLWLLLPVWLSGVALYYCLHRWTTQRTLPAQHVAWTSHVAWLGWLLSLALLAAFHASGCEQAWRAVARQWWPLPGIRLGSADRFLSDYVVCLLVVANFACARLALAGGVGTTGATGNNGTPATVAAAIRTLSAYTFTLYLVHEPVIAGWHTFHGHDRDSMADMAALTVLIGAATWAAGQLTERRRHWFRAPFEALFTLFSKNRGARHALPERRAARRRVVR